MRSSLYSSGNNLDRSWRERTRSPLRNSLATNSCCWAKSSFSFTNAFGGGTKYFMEPSCRAFATALCDVMMVMVMSREMINDCAG